MATPSSFSRPLARASTPRSVVVVPEGFSPPAARGYRFGGGAEEAIRARCLEFQDAMTSTQRELPSYLIGIGHGSPGGSGAANLKGAGTARERGEVPVAQVASLSPRLLDTPQRVLAAATRRGPQEWLTDSKAEMLWATMKAERVPEAQGELQAENLELRKSLRRLEAKVRALEEEANNSKAEKTRLEADVIRLEAENVKLQRKLEEGAEHRNMEPKSVAAAAATAKAAETGASDLQEYFQRVYARASKSSRMRAT